MNKISRDTLKFLVTFINELILNENFTKMNQYNLALMFGPNIFRGYNLKDPIEIMRQTNLHVSNMEIIIENADKIFNYVPLKRKNTFVAQSLTYSSMLSSTDERPDLYKTVAIEDKVLREQAGKFDHTDLKELKVEEQKKPSWMQGQTLGDDESEDSDDDFLNTTYDKMLNNSNSRPQN